ncbi:MAG: hypothetical protein U9N62_03235 [Thermotogota bacterium]|nr:hypothetical protein [Thermotogota bacterium]
MREEKAIIEAIKEGKSRNQIAKQFKRSAGSISRIAKKQLKPNSFIPNETG